MRLSFGTKHSLEKLKKCSVYFPLPVMGLASRLSYKNEFDGADGQLKPDKAKIKPMVALLNQEVEKGLYATFQLFAQAHNVSVLLETDVPSN